jgi:hypothetical protein
MKVCALAVAVFLAGCEDLAMTVDAGSGMGGNDLMGDPRDDPFLVDINNAWGGGPYHFTFDAKPRVKNSSAVVGGSGSVPSGSNIQLDGIFYDHTVHFTVTQGANVLTFDGIFINVKFMDVTVEETQAHVRLNCSTEGGNGECK